MSLVVRKIKRYGWVPDTRDQRDHLYAAPAVFGFAKVCYYGIAKNANRLCVACALATVHGATNVAAAIAAGVPDERQAGTNRAQSNPERWPNSDSPPRFIALATQRV